MAEHLYIHIPFCIGKCAYCSFFSVPIEGRDTEAYVEALLREVEHGKEARFTTVYIGGGTPTALPRHVLKRLMQGLSSILSLSEEAEFTVEANPGSLDREKLVVLRENGVNRLSLGFQSFSRQTLQLLGRIHNEETNRETFLLARESGFDNINIDLIYGVPGQKMEDVVRDIEIALELEPDHISCYELSLEPGSALYAWYQEARFEEETLLRMAESIRSVLESAGYGRYEVSNYALTGFECRHNVGYWLGHDYAAAGAGAVSLENGVRIKRTRDIDEYIGSVKQGKVTVEYRERLDRAAMEREYLMMGLRMRRGIRREEFARRTGGDLDKYIESIRLLQKEGYVEYGDERLRVTEKGFPVLNEILLTLYP